MKKKKIIRKPPTRVHTFRCTDEEYEVLKNLAQKCGLSLSRYVVETGLKHHPRQRLTPEECHALDSLMTARQDLVKVSNALNGKTDEEKLRMFKSGKFMNWWIMAVAGLIQHWQHIEENITSSVQTKSNKGKETAPDNACQSRCLWRQCRQVRNGEREGKSGQGEPPARRS